MRGISVFLAFSLLLIGSFYYKNTSVSEKEMTQENTKAALQTMQLPLAFEANHGQFPAGIEYSARAPGFQLYLQGMQANMVVPVSQKSLSDKQASPYQHVVMQFLGANGGGGRHWQGLEPSVSTSSYYRGADPSQWITGVRHFEKVFYEGMYDGIDISYYGNPHELEYDFIVQPGADPHQIVLGYEGITHIKISDSGDAQLQLNDQPLLTQHKPIAYQVIDGERYSVDARYILTDTEQGKDTGLTLALAEWDHEHALIIDPVLSYSSFYGGSARDGGESIVVDNDYIYVSGHTYSNDFPGQGQVADGHYGDVFVSKLNPLGNKVLWTVILGGTASDGGGISPSTMGSSIAIGYDGSVYVAGSTNSHDFPMVNAIDNVFNNDGSEFGAADGFVSKISADGRTLVFSTYIGGGSGDYIKAIAVDDTGYAYIGGGSRRISDFLSTYDMKNIAGCRYSATSVGSAFAAKIKPDGDGFVYLSCIADNWYDQIGGLVIDDENRAYIAGSLVDTFSDGGAAGYQVEVKKIDSTGSFVLSKYSFGQHMNRSNGAGSHDMAHGIAIDDEMNVYITGETNSETDFATSGAYDKTLSEGGRDAFAAKLNSELQISYITYLGGAGLDKGYAIAADKQGNAWLSGVTGATDFPTTKKARSRINKGESDAFLTKINAEGTRLKYSTYLGSRSSDQGLGVDVSSRGDVYVTGIAATDDFPTTPNALNSKGVNTTPDAFIARFGNIAPPGKPLLFVPKDSAPTHSPMYVWKDVKGATHYRLWLDDVSKDEPFERMYSREEANCFAGYNCSVTLDVVAIAQAKWRVQAYNAVGNGLWSKPSSFLAPPGQVVLTKPIDGAHTKVQPLYKWKAALGAKEYCLKVVDLIGDYRVDECFTKSKANCSSDKQCSFKPKKSVFGESEWWVSAKNKAGYGVWSEKQTFVAPPEQVKLIKPLGATSQSSPPYTWQSAVGAEKYHLTVNDAVQKKVIDRWYTKAEAGCPREGVCRVRPDTPVRGTVTWRVQAWNESGSGEKSSPLSFRAPPGKVTSLDAPKGKINTQNPEYVWQASPGATRYLLWVDDGKQEGVIREIYSSTRLNCQTNSVCRITPKISVTGSARWRVMAKNGSISGKWSRYGYFRAP